MQLCILKYGTDERCYGISRDGCQKMMCVIIFPSSEAWKRSVNIRRESGKATLGGGTRNMCVCVV